MTSALHACAVRVAGFTKEMKDWYFRCGQFSFGAVIPVPDFKGVTVGTQTSDALAVDAYKKGNNAPLEEIIKSQPKLLCNLSYDVVIRRLEDAYMSSPVKGYATLSDYAAQVVKNIEDWGYSTALSFRLHKWGTPLDATHVSYDEKNEMLEFDSGLFPPLGVVSQMSKDFPGDGLYLTWIDNDGVHKHAVKDGLIEGLKWDEYASEEDDLEAIR